MKIYLYSTVGCHLREQAKVIVWPLLTRYQCRLMEIDIATSDELIEQYGTSIPVLSSADNSSELNWPFTVHDVDQFLQNLPHFNE